MSLFIDKTVIKRIDIRHYNNLKLLTTEFQKAKHSNEGENFTTIIGGNKAT